ncbi:hypothetical protein DYB37_007456 [Aphanomyces astaci]|uniref:Uncharacterized protein n=1 Tax=Aphanomyces astaci TaxID=112090 RepID=A0A3R6XMJ6_APHAT|nr:hypothetical protein DYB35_007965 [Aphanomyces astaci]RHZ26174.1 hypothetical protein DYB37_007456 [Aphanomyces astaci]
MWEWRLCGVLNEVTQELLDTLAITLGALKVSQALLPECRTDLFIVLPMPNIGIKFRNLTSSSAPMLECAKEIEGTCGAQQWLKKRVHVPEDMNMEDDDAVKQAIVGSGVEELEQVEIKFPLQRLRLYKERQQWRLATPTKPVQVEITSLATSINDATSTGSYFTICVESKSVDALVECLVKLAIGEVFEQHAIQNIYVVETIHLKHPSRPSSTSTSPSKADVVMMVPPTHGPHDMDGPNAPSPLKRKIAAEGSRLRLIEMGYPALACHLMQSAIAQQGKEVVENSASHPSSFHQ